MSGHHPDKGIVAAVSPPWLISRESAIFGVSSLRMCRILDRMPQLHWGRLHLNVPDFPMKIIEVADIALWRIEQRHEFRPIGSPSQLGAVPADRYWNLTMWGHIAGDMWRNATEPHSHNPYVVHRVIDRASALIRHACQLGLVEIYVAEMIPAEDRGVAFDACLQNDIRRAREICESNATTETLALLALDTILIEADIARTREQIAGYQ